MTTTAQPDLTIDDRDGRPLARAQLQVDRPRAVLHLVITVPPSRRTSQPASYQRFVEDILGAADLPPGARLQAVLPAHDDLFDQLRSHCSEFSSRPFGDSYLIEGVLNGRWWPGRSLG